VVPLACVHVLVEVVGLRVRALVGELDDVLDLVVDLDANVLEVLLIGEAALLELVLKGDDRVGLAPLLLVLVGAVLVRVDHGVAAEAVAESLDEPRLESLRVFSTISLVLSKTSRRFIPSTWIDSMS